MAAHQAGARVAVHATVPGAGQLVAAGVDSVERGWSGLDEHIIRDMADRGTAWTPTVGALTAMLDAPGITPRRRRGFAEGRARAAELLPLVVRLGVPVLAGTDVTGVHPAGGRAAGANGPGPQGRAGRGQHLAAPVSRRPGHRRHRHIPTTTPDRTPASWPIRPLSWPAESGCAHAPVR